MATWAWYAIAVGIGAIVGLEVWSWLRHGTSAIFLAGVGAAMLIQGAIVALVVGAIAYGVVAGVTGWDPIGFNEGDSGAAAEGAGENCDPSYPDVCLDPDALDYDCESGEGDGPEYVSGPIAVEGDDPFELDRDHDGIGCDAG